ncbi:hypothetical protein ACOSQ3_004256 [Xanthoceras sorbifolium]
MGPTKNLPKPISLLNINGFYDGLLSFLDYAVEKEFISTQARRILVTAYVVHQLIEQLEAFILEYDKATSKLDWSVDEGHLGMRALIAGAAAATAAYGAHKHGGHGGHMNT